jgi:hypothetical protein
LAGPGSLRIDDPDVFAFPLFRKGFSRCRGSLELTGRDKSCVPPVDSQHVSHHLPGNRERGPASMSVLPFPFVEKREFLAVARGGFFVRSESDAFGMISAKWLTSSCRAGRIDRYSEVDM